MRVVLRDRPSDSTVFAQRLCCLAGVGSGACLAESGRAHRPGRLPKPTFVVNGDHQLVVCIEEITMSLWRPDATFYPSPKMAMQAPPEKLAYVAMLNRNANNRHDALGVVDLDPASSGYSRLVGQLDMPNAGDELHHFGWNACSACLCPYAPHPHVERRYLIVPGLRSSRIHIIDTK